MAQLNDFDGFRLAVDADEAERFLIDEGTQG